MMFSSIMINIYYFISKKRVLYIIENREKLEMKKIGFSNEKYIELQSKHIKDRIKRFAKIGGEMVSLNAVDEMVRHAYEQDSESFSYGVVAVPHESKGEQIVLVTNNRNVTQEGLHNYIKANAMSELYLPRVILFRDSLPVFATGKADNVTLKKDVMEELGLTPNKAN